MYVRVLSFSYSTYSKYDDDRLRSLFSILSTFSILLVTQFRLSSETRHFQSHYNGRVTLEIRRTAVERRCVSFAPRRIFISIVVCFVELRRDALGLSIVIKSDCRLQLIIIVYILFIYILI